MKRIAATILVAQTTMVAALFVLRYRHRELFEDGTLTLVTEGAPGTSLRYAHAWIEGERLKVHGRVIAESGAASSESDGTVLLVVLSPEGRELGRSATAYHLSPKLPKGGGGFSVELPLIPPDGSVTRISWEQAKRTQQIGG